MNPSQLRMSPVLVALSLSVATLAPAFAAEPAVGDLHLSYPFATTGETMTYRLFVPKGYDGVTPMPLVVILHGAGEIEDAIFDRYAGAPLKELAQQRGYMLLAPRGYSASGGFGDIYPVVVTRETAKQGAALAARRMSAPAGAAPSPLPPRGPRPPLADVAVAADDYVDQPKGELSDTKSNELSEQEVLDAIKDVRSRYRVDASRMYLMGNSMGGVGAAYFAVKYPQMWAAVSPSGGPVAAWSYPFSRLRDYKVPVLFVHGEYDEHANPHWSSVLVDAAKADGADARLLVVKGGHHGDAWTKVLPETFDFFGAHRR